MLQKQFLLKMKVNMQFDRGNRNKQLGQYRLWCLSAPEKLLLKVFWFVLFGATPGGAQGFVTPASVLRNRSRQARGPSETSGFQSQSAVRPGLAARLGCVQGEGRPLCSLSGPAAPMFHSRVGGSSGGWAKTKSPQLSISKPSLSRSAFTHGDRRPSGLRSREARCPEPRGKVGLPESCRVFGRTRPLSRHRIAWTDDACGHRGGWLRAPRGTSDCSLPLGGAPGAAPASAPRGSAFPSRTSAAPDARGSACGEARAPSARVGSRRSARRLAPAPRRPRGGAAPQARGSDLARK